MRARERYVEDYEVTTGTTYWDVELEHADPRLTVALFARERHEPRDADARRPGPDRPDWTHEMRAFAERCSRDLDLPLLTDPTELPPWPAG